MNNHTFSKIWIKIFFSLLFLPQIIQADEGMAPVRATSFSGLMVAGIFFLINYFLLAIGYLIIKRWDLLKTKRFTGYVFLVTITILLTRETSFEELFITSRIFNPGTSFTDFSPFIISFLLVAIYNYWLAKILLKLSVKQLIFISIWAAIFTWLIFVVFTILAFASLA